MYKSMNINDMVMVKLNIEGHELYKQYYNTDREKTSSDGWVKFQLWEFMAIYGPHMKLGAMPPFCTGIKVFVID